jgi:hypothetical protein
MSTAVSPILEQGAPHGSGFFGFGRALRTIAIFKFAFLLFALLWSSCIPIRNTALFENTLHWPETNPPTFWSRFTFQDAAFYLTISQDWYENSGRSQAFYPLLPCLIHLARFDQPELRILCALAISNAFSIIGLLLTYRIAQRRCGDEVAYRGLVLLLAAPGAVFFNLIYTESLFLLLITSTFYFLQRNQIRNASLLALFLPLTKAIGVLVFVPALVHHLRNFAGSVERENWGWFGHGRNPHQQRGSLVPVLAILVGFGIYLFLMWCHTGHALAGFEAQRLFPAQPSIARVFDAPALWRAFTNVQSWHGMLDSCLDRLFFIAMVCTLPALSRLDWAWFSYCLVAGCVPAFSSGFMSYTRYIMVCFPVFIVWAATFSGQRQKVWFRSCVGLLATIQCWLTARQLSCGWAG